MQEKFFYRISVLILLIIIFLLFSENAVKSSSPAPSITVSAFAKTRGEFFLVDPQSGKVILYRMSYSSPDKANFQIIGMTDYKKDISVHTSIK